MSFKQRIALLSALLIGCVLLPASSFAQLSFQPSQPVESANSLSILAHGDFNNDGREDLVASEYFTNNGTIAYQLYLSNGDSTYEAPKTLPASVDAIGDFNGDGKLDFASFHTGPLLIYLGNGDGTFQSPKIVNNIVNGNSLSSLIVAADLNHDGKTDLVVTGNANGNIMQIYLSNGDGTFSKGQTLSPIEGFGDPGDRLVTGDFDGDGKPDVAILYQGPGTQGADAATIQVWYGDGAGHLGSPFVINDPNNDSDTFDVIADVNNNGRSDIIASPTTVSDREPVDLPNLSLFAGNSNRTLTFSTIATSECAFGVAVADFNGDGVNDLFIHEATCDQSVQNPTSNLYLRLGQGSGNFGPEQSEYQYLNNLSGPSTIRTTLGTKPDLVFGQQTEPANNNEAIALLTNTSSGAFPGCGLSGFAEGVQVCTPGATATSPVQFSVGAAGPTPMRTAAVWADGVKVAEQLTHAFSNYSFLDASVPLAAGKYAITVYGTGWDDTLQKKSFTLTVGSGTCSAPTSAGVHVCQPASGASVSSPIAIQATSTITGKFDRMEVWVDGVKQYTETSGTTLNTTLSVAAGTHRFGIFAVNTAGTKWEEVVDATVK